MLSLFIIRYNAEISYQLLINNNSNHRLIACSERNNVDKLIDNKSNINLIIKIISR